MRNWIDLFEIQSGISARRHGDTIELDTFVIPLSKRSAGQGRCKYQKWEASLPHDIKYVELDAVDGGSGPSKGFWIKMGFEPMYWESDDPDFDIPDRMIKGVNGHPTPPPIEYDGEDIFEATEAKPPRLYPAVMVNGKKTVVRDKGATHFDALDLATAGMERNTAAMWRLDDNVRGFVNERGRWLNRYRAADYARAYDLFDRDSPNWCDWMATSPDLISETPLK